MPVDCRRVVLVAAGFPHTFSCVIRLPHDGNLNDRGTGRTSHLVFQCTGSPLAGLGRGRHRVPRGPANHPLVLAQLGSEPLGPPKSAGSLMARPKYGETAQRTGTLAKRAGSLYGDCHMGNRPNDSSLIFFIVLSSTTIMILFMKQEGIDGLEEIPNSILNLYVATSLLGILATYVIGVSSWVTLHFTVRPLRRWERHCEIAIARTRRVLLSTGMTNEDGKQWFKALLKDPDTPPPSFLSKDRS